MLNNEPPDEPKFVAGWNNPGYLPETDPCYFDTAVEACRYLVDTIDRLWDDDYATTVDTIDRLWDDDYATTDDTIDRWWDDDYYTTDDDTELEDIDARWIGAHSQLPYLTPPFSIIANGISFWIEPLTEGN